MAHERDILFAGQLAPALPGSKPFQGERRLMLAVLGDAVDCYRRGRRARDPATRLLFDETRAWLESTDRRALFSFESICDALDIDADYLRRGCANGRRPAGATAVRRLLGGAKGKAAAWSHTKARAGRATPRQRARRAYDR